MSASRFCPNCGQPVPAGNNFCVSCGYALSPPTAGAPPGAPVAPGAVPPAGPPPPVYVAGYPQAPPPPYAPMPPRANFSTMLSGTFDVWTRNFGPLFLVYLILALVTGGLSLLGAYAILGAPIVGGTFLPASAPSGANLLAYFAYQVVVSIIGWVLTSAVLGGVVDFAVRRYRSENVRIMESLSRGFQRVLSILGANLLVTLITLGVFLLWAGLLVVGAISMVAGGSAAGIALICGGILAFPFVVVLVIYLDLALCLYAPTIMMEGAHAVPSLERSWGLTKGRKWSIFGAGLVLGIILVLIDGAIGAIGSIGGNPFVAEAATALATAITGSWFAILTAVAYDLILREPRPSAWPPAYTPAGYPPR